MLSHGLRDFARSGRIRAIRFAAPLRRTPVKPAATDKPAALAPAGARALRLELEQTRRELHEREREVARLHSELRRSREDLAAAERGFRQLADAAFEVLLVHDGRIILDCNPAAAELYGIERDALLGKPLAELAAADSDQSMSAELDHSYAESIETRHRRADGRPVPVEIRSKTIELHGAPAVVTAVRDITEHQNLRAHLEKLASTDALTGVPNRRGLMDAGRREYSRCLRYGQSMAALMIDADRFKRINDIHGHELGDRALQHLAAVCQSCLRASDVFGRYGGEEFTALLPSTDFEGAMELAERMRACIAAEQLDTDRLRLRLTASIGVGVLGPEDEALDTLLNRADQALLLAKRSGRNRVAYLL